MKKYRDLYLKYASQKADAQKEFQHTSTVLQIARQLAQKNNLKVNWEVLEPAILLHDIGVFECEETYKPRILKPYIQHALIGALIVRAEGFSDKIATVIERHIGSGISQAEIETQNLPLPHRDFLPQTIAEKLLCYADKFHSVSRGFVSFEDRMQEFTHFGHGPVERLRDLRADFGIPD